MNQQLKAASSYTDDAESTSAGPVKRGRSWADKPSMGGSLMRAWI